MTFITLTDADNGQGTDVQPGEIALTRVLDLTHTLVIMKSGYAFEVRESRDMIKRAIALFHGDVPDRPKATVYEGGRW